MQHTGTIRRSLAVSVAAAIALSGAACGTSGDSAAKATTTTAKAAPAKRTTTTEKAGASKDLIDAYISPLYQLRDDWQAASVARSQSSDAATGIAHTADLRTAVFDFDAAIRKIEFPADLTAKYNALLTADGDLIAKLDAFQGVAPADLNRVYDEQQTSLADWQGAADDLADALGIPTVTLRVDASSSGSDSTSTDTTTQPADASSGAAGERFALNVVSLVVADGWSGSGGSVDGPGGVRISSGRLSGYSGNLSAVAQKYASNVADKNDYTVKGKPGKVSVNGSPAVVITFRGSDGYGEVDVVFEDGGEFYAIDLHGDATKVASALDDFQQMLDTVEVT